MARAIVDGSSHQCLRLINVIRLRGRQERSRFIEAVCPGEVELLQVVMPGFKFPVVDGVDPAKQ